MRIALDATYSVGRKLSGVGVYSREILTGLLIAHPEASYSWCFRPHRLIRGLEGKAPARVNRTLLLNHWPVRVDLFHALNQRVDARRWRRVVTTFHDLFVITSEYSTPEFRARFSEQARLAAGRSDLIIAVSRFTAAQVEDLLHVPASRIRVIHHGVGPANPSDLSGRFILFVGAIQKRKNVLGLLRAFEGTPPGWKLVLAGAAGFGAEAIQAAIEQSPRRTDIQALGYVPAETLEALYQKATIFAFPSFDEGFGMPVLDAMAHGIPVLTSNRSALREISEDAALLVDPYDQDSLSSGLKELTGNEILREKLRQKGFEQSRKFPWNLAVESTWAVYAELLG